MALDCFDCDTTIDVPDDQLSDAFLAHAQDDHDWPYPPQAIRNYAEATLRLTGSADRLDDIGEVSVHAVTEDRLDDWRGFFDRDAFVGTPEWAACYCIEPHTRVPDGPDETDVDPWHANREEMADRLRDGGSFGYLAYVEGRVAGWVNASKRSDYTLYRLVDPDGPPAGDVIGVSCFIIAPPYRRHGVASALLDRVLADAGERGAVWVEGYPFNDPEERDAGHFRGPRSMYDARDFEPIEVLERYTVVRRPV